MKPKNKRRQIDANVIARWVNKDDRVLDLGCGRGVLLEYLKQNKSVNGVGVDINFEHILSCVRRGVTAYHGDIRCLLAKFENDTFDRVIFSRSIGFVNDPDIVLAEALRVGKRVTVGFLNHAFWKNRLKFFVKGRRFTIKDLQQQRWYESQLSNPFSVGEFDEFCSLREIRIVDRTYLSGDLNSESTFCSNLFASYAIYDLAKNQNVA